MKKIKLISKNVLIITIISFLLLVLNYASVSAFSDYEKDVAEKLYEDLDQKYKITEFGKNTHEYQILKRLESNIITKKFRNEEFKLHHIDDKLINAYYIGDGNIMLFEGLLQELNTEDQLAGLIAHEMGHAVKEHLTEDLERNMSLSILNLLFNHFTENDYQLMTNIAQNLIANGYSREQEQESDIYAVDLMMRSGYDPEGLIELMKIFKENSHNVKLLEFTQTHPIPDSRIEYLQEYIVQKKSENATANVKNEKSQTMAEADKNKSESKVQEPVETESQAYNLNNKFKEQSVRFSYPENWSLKKQRIIKKEVMFNYQVESENLKGIISFEDLSQKSFMQTARKQFVYSAITAEENGAEVRRNTIEDSKLEIYQLEIIKNGQPQLEYFINQKNEQQMLKFSFELDNKSKAEQQKLIKQLIKTVNFLEQ